MKTPFPLPIILRGYGLDFNLVRTERQGHAVALARQAVEVGYNVLITVCGDGTANEVLNSLMLAKSGGGGFMMAPEGEVDDGLLDSCIAEQVSRPRIFALILCFVPGTQAYQPSIKTGRTPRIFVSAVGGVLPAHADGATLCTDGKQLAV